MTNEKWELFIDRAKSAFADVNVYTEDFFVESNSTAIPATRDILEFSNSLGHFKVTRENKPALLEKKMHYSHRQGDSARAEYVFSNDQLTHKVRVYKEDQLGEWQELAPDQMDFIS